MGWKFWKREQTEAERSLAALQQQAAQPTPAPAPPVADAEPESEAERRMRAAMEHMEQVSRDLGAILDLPPAETGTFMLEVTGLEAQVDGSVALVGGAHEGDVTPGEVVGALVLPQGLTHDDPAASEESALRLAEALLAARAVKATVVSWDATVPRLVVTGVGPGDLTVGSMISR